jgi:predicted nucleotidyltransferase
MSSPRKWQTFAAHVEYRTTRHLRTWTGRVRAWTLAEASAVAKIEAQRHARYARGLRFDRVEVRLIEGDQQ